MENYKGIEELKKDYRNLAKNGFLRFEKITFSNNNRELLFKISSLANSTGKIKWKVRESDLIITHLNMPSLAASNFLYLSLSYLIRLAKIWNLKRIKLERISIVSGSYLKEQLIKKLSSFGFKEQSIFDTLQVEQANDHRDIIQALYDNRTVFNQDHYTKLAHFFVSFDPKQVVNIPIKLKSENKYFELNVSYEPRQDEYRLDYNNKPIIISTSTVRSALETISTSLLKKEKLKAVVSMNMELFEKFIGSFNVHKQESMEILKSKLLSIYTLDEIEKEASELIISDSKLINNPYETNIKKCYVIPFLDNQIIISDKTPLLTDKDSIKDDLKTIYDKKYKEMVHRLTLKKEPK